MQTHATVNKVILAGKIDKEPSSYVKNGKRISNFSLVTTEKIRRSGTEELRHEYHQVQVTEQVINGENHIKWTPVYIQGRLQTAQFTDELSVKRYKTVIVANFVEPHIL
jgi:single-stranded DNA-binding protein